MVDSSIPSPPEGGWGPGGSSEGSHHEPSQKGWLPPETGSHATDAPFAAARAQGLALSEDDLNNAFFAHAFAAVANLVFLGFGVPILAPLLVLLIAKHRSPFVLFHINQSVVFQGVLFLAMMSLAAIVTLITVLTCGFGVFLYFLAAIPPLIGIVYPLIVGLAAKNGEWKLYPYIGERVLHARNPLIR